MLIDAVSSSLTWPLCDMCNGVVFLCVSQLASKPLHVICLDMQSDVLDWHGDHPYTNFHDAFDALRKAGFFVEVMHSPGTCFDPANYGAYLLLDSEEEWYK